MIAVVTIDWRTAADGWPGGQILLVDLGSGDVLDRFEGSLRPQGLDEPGGWGGYRGVSVSGDRALVATFDGIRSFRRHEDEIVFERGWHADGLFDLHDVCHASSPPGPWALWVSATRQDAVAALSPWAGHRNLLERHVTWEGRHDKAVRPLCKLPSDRRGHDDLLHINSVSEAGSAVWALANTPGALIRFRPGPTWVHPARVPGGHSLTVTPEGLLLVCDTQAERLIVLSAAEDEPLRSIQTRSPAELADVIHPVTGKRAAAGWLRGCAPLGDGLCAVGTSPAQVFVVNYLTGEVVARHVFDDDVRASVFGIDVFGAAP